MTSQKAIQWSGGATQGPLGDVTKLLQSLLDEQHGKGFREGYEECLGDVMAFLKAKRAPGGALLADHPGDENDAEAEPASPGIIDGQPPYIRKALEYLKQHPGMTAHEARDVVKNRAAFRTLHELGLVEKRGPKFFPKVAR